VAGRIRSIEKYYYIWYSKKFILMSICSEVCA
jgi:hypothetical protein